jgi:hypothetical protein
MPQLKLQNDNIDSFWIYVINFYVVRYLCMRKYAFMKNYNKRNLLFNFLQLMETLHLCLKLAYM